MADEPTTAPTDTQVNTNDPSAATVDATATPEATTPGLMGTGPDTPETAPETDVKADAEPSEGGAQEEVATVPETYEFNLDAGKDIGYDIPPEQQEALSEKFKEGKFSKEQAQMVIDMDISRAADTAQAQQAAQEATVKEWVSELKTEFGDKYAEEVSIAGKAFEAFASPKLQELLNNTKLNYNPEVVKMFRDMGKKMSEDSFEKGGNAVKGKNEGGLKDMFSDLNKT